MSEVIHIEIAKGAFIEGRLRLRIGDVSGGTESSNITKEEALRDISDEIDELLKPAKKDAEQLPIDY